MELPESLKKLYEKIHPGYFAIVTGVVGSATIIIAAILYYLGEPFTVFSHWVSHLGWGPNNSGLVFTIGLCIAGAFAIPFLVYYFFLLRKNMGVHAVMLYTGLIGSFVSITGLFINAIFNYKEDSIIHVTGSTTFFFGGMVMILFYSVFILFNDEIKNGQAIYGLCTAVLFILFLTSFLPNVAQGEDLLYLLLSTDPKAAITRFLEWLVVFGVLLWFIETGTYVLKNHEAVPPK